MRANVRVHSPEELYTAQLRRAIALKQVQPVHPDDGAIEVLAYLVVAGVVWTFVGIVYFVW